MMKGQHIDPEEAVKIHQDLQAKQSVAIHWGTFALAYEVRREERDPLPPHLSTYLPSISPSSSPLLTVIPYRCAVLPGAPGSSQRGPGSDGSDAGVLLHTESRGVAPYITTGRRRV